MRWLSMNADTKAVLTAREVIAIDQDSLGKQASRGCCTRASAWALITFAVIFAANVCHDAHPIGGAGIGAAATAGAAGSTAEAATASAQAGSGPGAGRVRRFPFG